MNQRSNTLQVVHELPGRLRLRWPADLTAEEQRGLRSMLLAEPWVTSLRWSAASRSLVIELAAGCAAVRWQIALAAMGWQLNDVTHTSPATAPAPSAPPTGGWDQVSREVGGSLIGAVAGQVLLAGAAGTVGAVLFGPQGALILGATGSLVGAVIGSVLGSSLADGKNPAHSQVLPLTWNRLSTQLGEEMGTRSGTALGLAIAGPVGGLAGFAVGGMLGGQLGSDLTTGWKGVGKRRWFNSMVDDSAGEALSESLAARIGSLLGGNSPAARQLGASVGMRVGRKINWRASVEQRHLVNRLQVPT
jgi:hypothetical protein